MGILIFILGVISTIVLASVAPNEAIGQGGFVGLGLLAFVIASFFPRHFWKRSSYLLYAIVTILLITTLVRGQITKGATRWLPIGSFRLQVSEVAKPALALTLAAYVSSKGLDTQKKLFFFFAIAAIPITLVFVQPDLGSALVLSAITGGILISHIQKPKLLLPWVILGILGAGILWQFVLYPYQKARIFSFIAPASDEASSYNARQALIAAGSGKVLGRGLGRGVQSNLKFLPEFHTDFFFASFAEELGFVGCVVLFVLFAILFWLLFLHAGQLDPFDGAYRIGILYGLALQSVVHVGMNIGVLPVTGIPLPFLSSGGSSFVSLSLAVGIAMALRQKEYDPETILTLGKTAKSKPML